MRAVDGVSLTVLVENYVDMLLPDTERVKRAGLCHHFDPKRGPVMAENGISFLAEIHVNDYTYRLLFDSGFTSTVIRHNMRNLGVNASANDHVVVSHGHPDHCGDLPGMLREIGHPVPVSVHPDAFWPRYLRLGSGEVSPFYESRCKLLNPSTRHSEAEAEVVAAHHEGSAAFPDEPRRDLIDRRRAGLPHGHPELVDQHLDDLVHTIVTERAQPPDIGSTDPDCIGTERQRLEDVRSAADATIEEDGNPSANARRHFRKSLDR